MDVGKGSWLYRKEDWDMVGGVLCGISRKS